MHISKDLFDRCEAVRLGKSRQTATRCSEKSFVCRGLLNYAVSSRAATCDVKNGKQVYLICRDPATPSRTPFIPEIEVLGPVEAVFRSIQVPENRLSARRSRT